MTSESEKYMKHALNLAEKGLGYVSPNPMVGCVIVHDGKIIGEGYHEKYGGAHAEVNAVNSVENQKLLSDSDFYVTLEPCAHYGKTPPCAELIKKLSPKKVFVCNLDPNPLVAGKGIKLIRDAGLEVQLGVLEEEGRFLNRRFFTFHEQQRPYIILKWAETKDGFIARSNYDSKWISNDESRDLVHQWRAEEDGIMVGTNTAQYDNPRLNVRNREGKDPVRIVIDKNLRLSSDMNLFDRTQSTICYNESLDEQDEYLNKVKIKFDDNLVPRILNDLRERGIQSVIIEGGTRLLQSFIDENNFDEIRRFVGTEKFTQGILAPNIADQSEILLVRSEKIAGDVLEYYFMRTK